MGKLLVVLLVLAAALVGLGVYLDWFHFSTSGDKDSGKVDVGVTIDKDKIKADAEKAKEDAKALGSRVKEKAGDAKPQETVPPK
jgi:hypothetical protein